MQTPTRPNSERLANLLIWQKQCSRGVNSTSLFPSGYVENHNSACCLLLARCSIRSYLTMVDIASRCTQRPCCSGRESQPITRAAALRVKIWPKKWTQVACKAERQFGRSAQRVLDNRYLDQQRVRCSLFRSASVRARPQLDYRATHRLYAIVHISGHRCRNCSWSPFRYFCCCCYFSHSLQAKEALGVSPLKIKQYNSVILST
jgi:hypothetical protein